jgi:outer membrane protein insertion porin family
LSFGLKQDNAFGSGNSLGVQINTSKINRVLVLNTTDPYFTADGVSRTDRRLPQNQQSLPGPKLLL